MNKIVATLSLLHQPLDRPGSTTRFFRGRPVVSWTLARLARCAHIARTAIICWDDQLPRLQSLMDPAGIFVAGHRMAAGLDAIATSLKWSDGWRGGILGACCYDAGFHAPFVRKVAQQFDADAVMLVDPDAGLIDPILVDQTIEHARSHPAVEFCFSPAAPGLSAALLRMPLLDRLATSGGYLGALLHYHPDHPGRDPILNEQCAPAPTSVARTLCRFTLDSDRQVRRLTSATESLNGQLMQTGAEQLVARLAQQTSADPLPRDVTLELTTRRATSPIYSPAGHLRLDRPELTIPAAKALFEQLAALDDIRITIAGAGDPLLHPEVFQIIAAAADAGIHSLHLETDLADVDSATLEKLAGSSLDLLSVHVPATSAATYASVMGRDALASIIGNIRTFLAHRQKIGRSTPILVPTFTKCRANIHEMEGWYDYWLRAVGVAVITAPSDCAGRVPDVSVADMSPTFRVPCRRLANRMAIRSDGYVASCEEDVSDDRCFGRIGQDSISEIWQRSLGKLRADHAGGKWGAHAPCANCKHWHRP